MKVIVGQDLLLDRMIIVLLTGGHLLLEGLPGLAKTLAVTSLAKTIGCRFKRIQFTPDLLPADLIGTSIYNPQTGSFSVSKGPIFTNILLADEVNRAPAKVQSALLEVMQEKQVTIAGHTFAVEPPFFVLATQNPIEQEGTYPLPEAQTDRFTMKVLVDYPSFEEERTIVEKSAASTSPQLEAVVAQEQLLEARQLVDRLYIDPKVVDYILNIVFATRSPRQWSLPIDHLLEGGASPRASIELQRCSKALALTEGRSFVTPYDVKRVAPDILRHRLRRSFEAEAEGISSAQIIETLLEKLPPP